MSQPSQSIPSAQQSRDANAPDFAAIKQRQQAIWASGDFAVIGVSLQIVGESLAEAADIRANERVIDVAAEGLSVNFREADAEALPFPDGSFDAALSTFGVMFTPDHARSASEMMRVVRAGGRIGLANWTPDGFIGQLFKTIGKHVAPPSGLKSPALWGTEDYLGELFGAAADRFQVERKLYNFRYASAAHWMQVFRTYYGPVLKAFAAAGEDGRQALEQDINALLDRFNTAGAASLVVPAEYLEVVITKRSA